jgi:prevent-host-death family protein
MATEVPQRELRNNTAELLRRVEKGERLRITVHGHPVADLVPIARRRRFVPFEEIVEELTGLLDPDDDWYAEIKAMRDADEPRDPWA